MSPDPKAHPSNVHESRSWQCKEELAAEKQKTAIGTGKEAELARLHQLQLEEEKEKRVAHLGQIGVKRMMNQKLSMGWTAWKEQYDESRRKQRLLRTAGQRLMRPALVHCFHHWQRDWEAETALVAAMTQEERLQKEIDDRAVERSELNQLIEDLRMELDHAHQVLESKGDSDADRERELNEQLEKEREARVAHLGQIGVKRMMNQKLSMGWSAWKEMYDEYKRKQRLLKNAGARLTKPKLVHAFAHWQSDWSGMMNELAAMGQQERLEREIADRKAVELENSKLRQELREAREAMASGKGQELEKQRQIQEQLEREREARVAHLGQIGVKRMMNQKLSMGWSAWTEMYIEFKRKRNLLKTAGARLTRPALVHSFHHWQDDWKSTMAHEATMSHAQLMQEEKGKRYSVEQELSRVKLELEEARASLIRGDGKEADMKRSMEAMLEAEREARVAHLGQIGVKRMMNHKLSLGWSAWHEMYTEYIRKRNLLKAAGARLTKPKLVHAFAHWQGDWDATMSAAAAAKMAKSQAQLFKEEETARKTAEAEVMRLKKELDNMRENVLSGDAREKELQRLADEKLEAERESRVAHLGQIGVKRMMNQKLSMGWTAWKEMYDEYTRKQRLLRTAGQRLMRPALVHCFHHWQRDWEAEMIEQATMTAEEKLQKEINEKLAAEAEVRKLRAELNSARAQALNGTGREAELERQMALQLEAEREKRVTHLGQIGVKRMMNHKLSLGWSAWHEMYTEYIRKRNLLKAAGARLTKPKLVHAFSHWQADWDATVAAEAAAVASKTQEELLSDANTRAQEAESEVAKLRAELMRAREAAISGDGRAAELERQHQLKLEEEKEKRVAHLGQIGVKRMMNQKLSMGWSAWKEGYDEYRRQRRLLMNAGARLTKPKLVHAFSHWQHDWEVETVQLAAMTQEERLQKEIADKVALEAQVSKLLSELRAAREAMASGKGEELERQRKLQEELEREREARVQHLGQLGIKRMMNHKLSLGWTAWLDMYREYLHQRNLLKTAATRLAKPKLVHAWQHWQHDWHAETAYEASLTADQKLAEAQQNINSLEAQVRNLAADLDVARAAALNGTGREAELERQMEEELEREREKRIAHLGQIGVKRMMNHKLSLGWTAWHDMYTEYIRKKNLLKAAGARLTKPKLVHAFAHWQDDWDATIAAAERAKVAKGQSELLAEEVAKSKALEAQVLKLNKELNAARDAAMSGDGRAAELERLHQLKLEEEKEKRVAHLGQIGVKRMLNQKLSMGWSAWLEMYEDYQRKKRLLKNAGARLTKPKLVHAFQHWQHDWDAVEQHKASMTQEQRLQSEIAGRRAVELELTKVRAELEAAKHAALNGTGRELEIQRQMEAQLEAEREQRVAHLGQIGVKRMMNHKLSLGWSAWHEMYTEYIRKRRLLLSAGARLTKPKLVHAFTHWQDDWDATELAKEAKAARMDENERLAAEAHEQQLADQARENELIKLRAELATAREAMAAGRGLELEMQRRLQEELEAEKEKRVAHLGQIGVKRMLNQKLSMGWSAWLEMYEDYQRKKRLLKNAGARLTKPKLVHAFQHWQNDWDADLAAKAAMSQEQRLQAEIADKKSIELENTKLRQQLREAREAMASGQGQEAERKRLMEEQLEREREARVQHLGQIGIKRMMNHKLSLGWSAWQDMYTEYQRKKNLLKVAGARLMKPKLVHAFAHWQRDWDAEMAGKLSMTQEERLNQEIAEKRAVEQRCAKLERELSLAQEAMKAGRGQQSEAERLMQQKLEEEREKRVAHLGQIGIKRMMNHKLSLGWSAWHEMYTEHKRKRNLLKAAGARLTKPKLVHAFAHWQEDWDAATAAKLAKKAAMTHEQQLAVETQKAEKLAAELAAVTKDLAAARQAMLDGTGREAEMQRLHDEKIEQEREKRVEHLGNVGLRRIMQQGLARGWTAWHDNWLDMQRKRSLLKAAGARLMKPKLVHAFSHWQNDWDSAIASRKAMSASERLQAEIDSRLLVEQELAKVTTELAAARQAMKDGRGQEAELERQRLEELAMEKEKRVAHLGQIGVRRLMKQGLARGWSAWHDNWLDYQHKKRLLKNAGARLTKPKLVHAFAHWQNDWDATISEQLAMTHEERLQNEIKTRIAVEQQCAQLEAQLRAAREAALSGTGREAELERLHQLKLEEEKEKRVAHLGQIGVKRMMNQKLSMGWSAWLDMYNEYKRKRQLLRAAGARLTKPKLVHAFAHWQEDWDALIAAKEAKRAKMTEAERIAEAAKEQREKDLAKDKELQQLRADLAAAREAALSGTARELELERLHQLKLDEEKEKRVAHLGEIGVKRMMNQKLSMGWSAWLEMYEDHHRKKRLLKAAGARLTKPKLVHAFAHWQNDWDADIAEKAAMSHTERLDKEIKDRQAVEAECSQLRSELRAAREAMANGQGQEAELERIMNEKLAFEREQRVAHLQQIGVKRMMNHKLSMGWSAWLDMYESITRKKRLLKTASARLTKPKLVHAFAHWQHDWNIEMSHTLAEKAKEAAMTHEQKLAKERDMRKMVEEQLARVEEQLKQARIDALSGDGRASELERLHQLKLEEEKQKRIEHLQQNALRRIIHKDIGRGWTAWADMYLEKKRQERLLKKAGNRLSKPKVAASFAHWQNDWQVESTQQAMMSTREKFENEIAALRTNEHNLTLELQGLKMELIAARENALSGNGREFELQRQHEAMLEAEREKRVAHLQGIGVRRLMQQGIARGWSAWIDMYEDINHKKRLLKAAAARLTKPKLVHAFAHWQNDWDVENAEKEKLKNNRTMKSLEERLQDEATKRAEAETAAMNAKLELIAARESMLAGSGKDAERERKLIDELESEREKRVTHLQGIGIRRLMKQGIARGWSAWIDYYDEYMRKKRMLRAAGSRMLKPKLVHSFKAWQDDWNATQSAAAAEKMKRQTEKETARREDVESQVAALRAQFEQQALLNKTALMEARQAAMDALSRMGAEKNGADEARRNAKDALESARVANQGAKDANELLKNQQDNAAAQLAQLLAEQRSQLTTEIVRIRDDYERQLAELRAKLAQRKEPKPPAPPPPVEIEKHEPTKKSNSKFHLVSEAICGKSINQQLMDQVKNGGLKVLDLFRELDSDGDGSISKKDWRLGMQKIGPDVPMKDLETAFDEADPDNSNSVEYAELDGFLRGRKQTPAGDKKVKKEEKKPRVKPSLLAALATSMGVRKELLEEAVTNDTAGSGEGDFESLMRARAEAFNHADLDFDGKLDFEEFRSMVTFRETKKYSEEELKAKFRALDADGSGKIDQYEFISYSLRDALKRSKGKAIDVFRVWDQDNSGYIDLQEFSKAIVALGFCCSKEDIKTLFEQLDEDGSGTIEYQELNTILRKGAGAAARPSSGGSNRPGSAAKRQPSQPPASAKGPSPSPRAAMAAKKK